jgi:hypothetical protein
MYIVIHTYIKTYSHIQWALFNDWRKVHAWKFWQVCIYRYVGNVLWEWEVSLSCDSLVTRCWYYFYQWSIHGRISADSSMNGSLVKIIPTKDHYHSHAMQIPVVRRWHTTAYCDNMYLRLHTHIDTYVQVHIDYHEAVHVRIYIYIHTHMHTYITVYTYLPEFPCMNFSSVN